MDLFPKLVYVYWDDPTADDKCLIAVEQIDELPNDASFVGLFRLDEVTELVVTRELI